MTLFKLSLRLLTTLRLKPSWSSRITSNPSSTWLLARWAQTFCGAVSRNGLSRRREPRPRARRYVAPGFFNRFHPICRRLLQLISDSQPPSLRPMLLHLRPKYPPPRNLPPRRPVHVDQIPNQALLFRPKFQIPFPIPNHRLFPPRHHLQRGWRHLLVLPISPLENQSRSPLSPAAFPHLLHHIRLPPSRNRHLVPFVDLRPYLPPLFRGLEAILYPSLPPVPHVSYLARTPSLSIRTPRHRRLKPSLLARVSTELFSLLSEFLQLLPSLPKLRLATILLAQAKLRLREPSPFRRTQLERVIQGTQAARNWALQLQLPQANCLTALRSARRPGAQSNH